MATAMEDVDLVDTDDYYAWLGLSKDAEPVAINNAFRKLSRIYHPDKHATEPELLQKAQELFPKIKKAHEVLADPQKRAIYDTMGIKGLETDGWEVVSRTKTPQEILEEYERLAKEREEKQLERRTNPKGTINVGIDATDLFERFDAEAMEYSSGFPTFEITDMAIAQSVECPLTTSDTMVLNGNLSSKNGRGQGHVSVTGRRVTSHNGWAELELGAGDGGSVQLRGFRTLWRRGFGTMSGTLQVAPLKHMGHVLRPSFMTMVATQLDKHVQGRITYQWSTQSSLTTQVVYDTEKHHILGAVQLGMPHSFAMMSYTRKFPDNDVKVKGAIRGGTFGIVLEYGCEKKITQFSTLGASVAIGIPHGVILKIKMNRGSQTFTAPIHLSEDIVPSAIVYGTLVPIAAYFAIKVLIIRPFVEEQKQKDLQKKKNANVTRLVTKRREAESAVELMKETVQRIKEQEEKKGGLLIHKALYGKLEGDQLRDTDVTVVTVPLQALVTDSRLLLPEGTSLSELPGFYDPCVGEDKEMSISYDFRRRLHHCVTKDGQMILLPNREHLVDQPSSPPSNEPS